MSRNHSPLKDSIQNTHDLNGGSRGLNTTSGRNRYFKCLAVLNSRKNSGWWGDSPDIYLQMSSPSHRIPTGVGKSILTSVVVSRNASITTPPIRASSTVAWFISCVTHGNRRTTKYLTAVATTRHIQWRYLSSSHCSSLHTILVQNSKSIHTVTVSNTMMSEKRGCKVCISGVYSVNSSIVVSTMKVIVGWFTVYTKFRIKGYVSLPTSYISNVAPVEQKRWSRIGTVVE